MLVNWSEVNIIYTKDNGEGNYIQTKITVISICCFNNFYQCEIGRRNCIFHQISKPKLVNPLKLLPANCLSVFDHFVGLALKRLNHFNINYKLNSWLELFWKKIVKYLRWNANFVQSYMLSSCKFTKIKLRNQCFSVEHLRGMLL